MKLSKFAAVAFLVGAGSAVGDASAQGWDGGAAGKVIGIDAAPDNNFSFRIWLDTQNYCGPGSPNWAYVNADSPNYSAITSSVMTAWSAGRTVSIYTTKDASGNCQIGYIVVR